MPTHLGSWHALAWMHLLDQELDAAQDAFNQALAMDRNFGDTHGGLAILAAMRGRRAEAEEFIRTARKLDRASMNAAVAMTLLQHGGSMNSKEFLEDAMRMLHKHALSKDEGMRVSFERLLAHAKR
jgi:Flp pilus assembly protein TadD